MFKLWHKITFSLIYSTVYAVLALVNVGPEANGTTVFFSPILPWIFLFFAIGLMGKLSVLRNRLFFAGIMILHYGIALLFLYYLLPVANLGESDIYKIWKSQSVIMLAAAAWYVGGQSLIWFAFYREIKHEYNERVNAKPSEIFSGTSH